MNEPICKPNGRTLFRINIGVGHHAAEILRDLSLRTCLVFVQRTNRPESATCYINTIFSTQPRVGALGWIPQSTILEYSKNHRLFDSGSLLGFIVLVDGHPYVDVFEVSQTSCIKRLYTKTATTPELTNKGKPIMKKVLENNSAAIKNASYLEAGRIGVNKMTKLIKPLLPNQAQPYAETAIGKLVVANAAMIAFEQLHPQNEHLRKLGFAMTTQAYSALLSDLNIEGIINDFLKNADVRKAIAKVAPGE